MIRFRWMVMFERLKHVVLCLLCVLPLVCFAENSDGLPIEASRDVLDETSGSIPSSAPDELSGDVSVEAPAEVPGDDAGDMDRKNFGFDDVAEVAPMPKGVEGYRDFWFPKYHGIRLSYCTDDKKTCGLALASNYCALMGYDKAAKMMIEHNVGLTRYPATDYQCQGWKCDGFKFITCQESLKKKPTPVYYYRMRDFAFPQFENYRVDWCYKQKTGCGKRAADSFCRHLGYRRSKGYEKEVHVSATRTIGSQALCFGQACSGFSRITCYR
jgi:hypothetical protein